MSVIICLKEGENNSNEGVMKCSFSSELPNKLTSFVTKL